MDKFEAVRFYGLASNFWQLTLNVAEELIERGNPSSMSYEGWGWPSDEEYEEHTKWSDLNIIEPTLFNFYHGIELSLKSLILAKEEELKNDHKLSNLLTIVKELYGAVGFVEFYEKYIYQKKLPEVINNFCRETGMTMDLYFQSLKYPTSTKGHEFNHSSLRALDDIGVTLFQEISEDLRSARKEVQKYIASECSDVLA
ncbi:MAG: HEPN domain-containing protein [Candidatus Thiodiazotropha sp. (ex Monitilora ramsayi)]|nr:HEPN domain-containing protein [Candidatus Thiodiazotropha sp. (ex Monitilora ramsayi)]